MTLTKCLECQKSLANVSKKSLKNLNDTEILVISSLAYNFCSGRVSLNKKEYENLKKFKNLILKLGAPEATKTEKKLLLDKNKTKSVALIKRMVKILKTKIKNKKIK